MVRSGVSSLAGFDDQQIVTLVGVILKNDDCQLPTKEKEDDGFNHWWDGANYLLDLHVLYNILWLASLIVAFSRTETDPKRGDQSDWSRCHKISSSVLCARLPITPSTKINFARAYNDEV
eukprot:scaffold425_cov175-Amphora_coffeaeformis.AAC.4